MKYIFETEHLGMRRFEKDDAPRLYAIHLDEEVRKWIPNESYEDLEEAQEANWFRTVENFIVNNTAKVTEEVQKAWEIIKQANLGDGKTPEKTVTQAYETIREWIESFGSGASDVAEAALDHIMEMKEK